MTSAAVAASDVQVATADLVIDLSRFAATIDTARLDAAVIKAVKTNILDTLSCALAGSSAKAMDCATFTAKPLPADTAARLISTVSKLESLPDIAAILRIVT